MAFDQVKYMAARRASALAAGLCGQCCKRPRDGKRYRCIECGNGHASKQRSFVENATARGTERRAATDQDWCIECQACGFHRDGCPVGEVQQRERKAS